jgi:hypothetical protein
LPAKRRVKVLIEVDKNKIKSLMKRKNIDKIKSHKDYKMNIDGLELDNVDFDSLPFHSSSSSSYADEQRGIIIKAYLQTGIAKVGAVNGIFF